MSLLEGSWFGGKPVAFFKFQRGSAVWGYTSSDRFETLLGDTYTPAAIKRTAIQQGSERGKRSITVSLPSALPVADNWRPFSPSEEITVTAFVRHVGEETPIVEWIGQVVNAKFTGPQMELMCEQSGVKGRRKGGGRTWRIGCDLILYEKGVGLCNLDPDEIPLAATLTAANEAALTITAAAFATAPRSIVGGRVEWTTGGTTHTRTITAASGEVLTLASFDDLLVAGFALTAYVLPLTVEATLTAVSGQALTALGFGEYASGRLSGGYIKWVAESGITEYRTIYTHTGTGITVDYGAIDFAPGLVVVAYPGCAHNWSACGQLENRPNYGGNLHMPIKNPYDGDPVW